MAQTFDLPAPHWAIRPWKW